MNGKVHFSVHAVDDTKSVCFAQRPSGFFYYFPRVRFSPQINHFKQTLFDLMIAGFADADMPDRLAFRQFAKQCRKDSKFRTGQAPQECDDGMDVFIVHIIFVNECIENICRER